MKKIYVGIVAVLFLLGLSGSASAIDWVLTTDTLAFGNTVIVGLNEIAFLGNQNQPQGIFGAGFTMTGNTGGVYFDADLWTWDSYNATEGYWDAFVVNVNTTDFYWNLSGLLDPVASNAPGVTWFWGGQTIGGLEHYSPLVIDSAILNAGQATYYVSIVLDTKTLPDSDTEYPSWGSFHVTPVPEPTSLLLLGSGLLGLAAFGSMRRRRS